MLAYHALTLRAPLLLFREVLDVTCPSSSDMGADLVLLRGVLDGVLERVLFAGLWLRTELLPGVSAAVVFLVARGVFCI